MLILIPILLLLVFAVLINFLGRYKLSISSTWLITAGSLFVIWTLLIIFRIAMPSGVSIANWSPLGIGSDLLIFRLSTQTWIFAFLLVSLLISVIFTDTIRLGQGNNLSTWTGAMVLTAVGMFSIYSQTLLAVIISWSIIDLVEFGLLIKVISHPRVHFAAILEFATRLLGTMLILGALVISNFHLSIGDNIQYSPTVYMLIILGATMRLGVLPLHVPLTANLPVRRSLGTMLRFVAPLSVFSFLLQVQSQPQYTTIINIFLIIGLITAFFGAIKWLVAKNELTGRPYWMLAFSGLVLISFLQGQIEGVIALSIAMIVCGGFIFLHSFKMRFVAGLGVLCMIGMMGIPFTPTASIWMSLINSSHPFNNILLIVTFSLLFFGFLKHLTRKREQNTGKEIWMQLFYIIGLALLVIIPWITMIWRFREIQKVGNWIIPIISLGIIIFLFFFTRSRVGQEIWNKPSSKRFITPGIYIGKFIGSLFQFEWFFEFLRVLNDIFTRILQFFINILEGDGGLLWALLFLALFSSILIGKLQP